MNCQSFETIVNDLAREQLIEASVREEAFRHSDECVQCSMRLADERILTLGLRALAGEMQSAEAPERVEKELLAAFNERKLLQRRPRSHSPLYLGATAAVLLMGFAIGIVAWNWTAPTENRAAKTASTTPHAPESVPSLPPASVVSSPESSGEAGPANKFVARRRKGNSGAGRTAGRQISAEQTADNENSASDSNAEVATDFMPLGYVNSLSLQDGGSVVRVELPRSTIVSMGFAVNMDRYGERVKADVLMGADGLARAIRFVQ